MSLHLANSQRWSLWGLVTCRIDQILAASYARTILLCTDECPSINRMDRVRADETCYTLVNKLDVHVALPAM